MIPRSFAMIWLGSASGEVQQPAGDSMLLDEVTVTADRLDADLMGGSAAFEESEKARLFVS